MLPGYANASVGKLLMRGEEVLLVATLKRAVNVEERIDLLKALFIHAGKICFAGAIIQEIKCIIVMVVVE